MAIATTLALAAGQAFDNLHPHWVNNSLKSTLTLFWQATLPIFDDAQLNSHPVSNWLSVLAATADQMASTAVPIEQLTTSAEIVYRLCWMAAFLLQIGSITGTQATFLLAQYNIIIGF